MECRFDLIVALGPTLIPCYIGDLRIGTGDSPLYRRWNTFCPSLLFLSGKLAE
ncbi:hypothetical protein HAX54_017955, partial [Datura stramonium]|nr:hypothetical protein [Datura stramonium]